METLTTSKGLITKVIGPVIDVEFPDGSLPNIYTALDIYTSDGTKIVAEVQQMLGANKVRTVAMSSTDGLKRGMEVINTNEPIKIPVGNAILGRILNVTGDAVDLLFALFAAVLLQPLQRRDGDGEQLHDDGSVDEWCDRK